MQSAMSYNPAMPGRGLSVLIAAVIVVAVPAPAAVGQDTGRLTFRAPVSELWLQASSYARNKRPGDCVEVVLPGRLDQPPLPVALTGRQAANWTTPEAAMASIRSANTAGDRDWILENFVKDEHAGLRAQVDDPVLLKRNLDYYKTIRTVEITGSAQLRGYTIVFIREEPDAGAARIVPVTLMKTASGWKQTNALSADETFDIVWAALRAAKTRGKTLGSC